MTSLIQETKEKNKIFQHALKELGMDTQTYVKYMYSMVPKSELDLMFIVDCTGSMSSWIQAVKNEIFTIVKQIKQQFKTSCIRLSFAGYRDIQDKPRFSIFPFSTNWRDFKKFVSGVSASGGGDLPEDVYGGFKYALEQKWASGARYAIFIADAPGHGNKYNDSNSGDCYPEGDPSGEDLEHFMKEFADKKINLFSAKITNCTDKMMKLLNQEYKIHSKVDIGQENLGQSVKGFSAFVVKTALQTIIKNQEDEGVEKVDNLKVYYRVVYQMRTNTEFCKSNLIFTKKYNEALQQVQSLQESMRSERDEDFDVNEFVIDQTQPNAIDSKTSISLSSITKGLKRLFSSEKTSESKDNNTKQFSAIKYEFTIKKENESSNLIRWDQPLVIQTSQTQQTISLPDKPFAVGKTNYIFVLNDQNISKVGRIPIRINRAEGQNLQYYINLNKDKIITQQIFGNSVQFCIYEVEINNTKFFISSELFELNLSKYDSSASFQPISYENEGLEKQVICHRSYQETLGNYLVANFSHPPNKTTSIFKPLLYSLNPSHLPSVKNQGYIGIFKFFVHHSCSEKCTDENKLIDLEDFTDPEKLNFKIPDPVEEVQV